MPVGLYNEDATLAVSNGANANDTTPDASGELQVSNKYQQFYQMIQMLTETR